MRALLFDGLERTLKGLELIPRESLVTVGLLAVT